MSLLTLGMTSARDSIYERAARGFCEWPSVLLLVVFGLLLLYIPVVLSTAPRFFSLMTRWLRKGRDNPEARLARLAQLRRMNFWLAISTYFFGAAVFVQILFFAYTNTVIARFNQTLAVASPYISAEQRTVFVARFASMKTRNDFVLLFEELNKIAESHGQPHSDFSPW